jgi:hypothetical protein
MLLARVSAGAAAWDIHLTFLEASVSASLNEPLGGILIKKYQLSLTMTVWDEMH